MIVRGSLASHKDSFRCKSHRLGFNFGKAKCQKLSGDLNTDEDRIMVTENNTWVTFFFFFLSFCLFSRAAPAAYGGSQARGQIRAVATGLDHSHSNSGSEPCLHPTPQFTATPDP